MKEKLTKLLGRLRCWLGGHPAWDYVDERAKGDQLWHVKVAWHMKCVRCGKDEWGQWGLKNDGRARRTVR